MRREGGQRKSDGQPGDSGAGRELRPEDQVDEIVDHYPQACGGCGRGFPAKERRPRRRFGRHQIAELPPISVVWTEHRTHQLRCRHCRARTSARLPDGTGGCAFGPRLQAAVVTLTARHRVSRRGICELARDLFGVTLSTGAADAICQRASEALAGPHLQRDFRRHADGLAEQKTFGKQCSPLADQVFAAWRSYQHEHHDRQRLQAEIEPIKTQLWQLLRHASPKNRGNRWHRQFANNLLKVWPALWTFTTTDGVQPTNNPAERALRGAVIHRKLSLGTQSEPGERFAE